MKLLKWGSKHDEQFWDISAPALENKAYKELFDILDEQGCYVDLEDDLKNLNDQILDLSALRKHLTSFKFINKSLQDDLDRWVTTRETQCTRNEIHQTERQALLYVEAKKGSVSAMKNLIHLRKDYEYEDVSIVNL